MAQQVVASSASCQGVLRVTVHRGRDVLSVDRNGKADPFVCVRFDSTSKAFNPSYPKKTNKWKGPPRKKTCTPDWETTGKKNKDAGETNSCFFWVFDPTALVTLELWDYNRITKDKQLGINTETQLGNVSFAVDQKEFTFRGSRKHEGKENVGVITISIKFLALADVATPFYQFSWPAATHVMLEMDLWRGCVEIQGDIDDILLLQIMQGLTAGIPTAEKDSQGRHRAWRVPFAAGKSYQQQQSTVQRSRDNLGQNLLLLLMDRFAACGFRLRRGNPAFMQVVGSGDNQRTIKAQDYYVLMQKTEPGMPPDDPNLPRHLYMDPAITPWKKPVYRIELQGAIPPQVLQALQQPPWELMREVAKHDQNLTLAYIISVPDMKKYIMSGAAFKKQENQWQGFAMKVMDMLQANGCLHATSWGDGHIYTFRSGGNYPQPRSHAMLDATYYRGFVIELQGDITEQEAAACAQAVGMTEVKKMTDRKSGAVDSYSVPLKDVKVAMTVAGNRKNANRMQNSVLKVLDQMNALGYVLMTAHDVDDLVLYRDPVAAASIGPTLLVEAAYQHGFQIEIQGNVAEAVVTQAAGLCQLTEIKRLDDDKAGGVLAWQLPVAGSKNTYSMNELRRKQNRIENMLLRVIDALSQFSFLSFMTYGTNGPLLMRLVPGILAGNYAMVDVAMGGAGYIAVELQGSQIEKEEAATAAALQAQGLPAIGKVLDKDQSFLCYQILIKVPSFGSVSSMRSLGNLIQNIMLKMMNGLTSLGYMHMFPAGSNKHVFYRPTAPPQFPPPVSMVPLHELPLLQAGVWQQPAQQMMPPQAQSAPMQQPMQPMQGQPMQGQPVQQPMPGQPMPGQPMPGQPMQGQPMQGQPMPGQPMQGQPMQGQPMQQPMQGPPMQQPMPGQPMPGQPMPGQPMPGQPMQGQPMQGEPVQQPMPGQPMQGQPMPGQPMQGQPMQGQPMQGQPMQQPMPGQPADGQQPMQQPMAGQPIGAAPPAQSAEAGAPPPFSD